jgi:hypothetical protein
LIFPKGAGSAPSFPHHFFPEWPWKAAKRAQNTNQAAELRRTLLLVTRNILYGRQRRAHPVNDC